MQDFLRKRTHYTVLPTPLPDDSASDLNDLYFVDTPTQDAIAVIDACLHSLYDVPRARVVFEQLRSKGKTDAIMNVRLYNSLIQAYVEMATSKDTGRKNHWVEDACSLYEAMESGQESVVPNPTTYALMLLIWHRFNPSAAEPVSRVVELIPPSEILQSITNRSIPVTLVVSDQVLVNSGEAEGIIKLLSKAAVDMNLSKVIQELGAAEILGRQLPDPLEDVSGPIPVLKKKVSCSNTPRRCKH